MTDFEWRGLPSWSVADDLFMASIDFNARKYSSPSLYVPNDVNADKAHYCLYSTANKNWYYKKTIHLIVYYCNTFTVTCTKQKQQ